MKTCPKCHTDKQLSEFYNRSNGKPGAYCKECLKTYFVNRWIEKKKQAITYKGGKCVDCQKSFEYYLYDFHHINPSEKECGWHKMRLYGWKKMKKELDKCILLCCMCHRTREQLHF